MCKCTPNIRTPWCGKPGCEKPVDRLSDDSPLADRISFVKSASVVIARRSEINCVMAQNGPTDKVDVDYISVTKIIHELESIIQKHESQIALIRNAFSLLTNTQEEPL